MSVYDDIRNTWQGHDLPNNSEILEAAERYREQCQQHPNYHGLPIGHGRNWVEGLATMIARSPREFWAPLFNRPVDPSDYKRQGM